APQLNSASRSGITAFHSGTSRIRRCFRLLFIFHLPTCFSETTVGRLFENGTFALKPTDRALPSVLQHRHEPRDVPDQGRAITLATDGLATIICECRLNNRRPVLPEDRDLLTLRHAPDPHRRIRAAGQGPFCVRRERHRTYGPM